MGVQHPKSGPHKSLRPRGQNDCTRVAPFYLKHKRKPPEAMRTPGSQNKVSQNFQSAPLHLLRIKRCRKKSHEPKEARDGHGKRNCAMGTWNTEVNELACLGNFGMQLNIFHKMDGSSQVKRALFHVAGGQLLVSRKVAAILGHFDQKLLHMELYLN